LGLQQGARRENILYGSLSDEQRRSGAKDRATLRAEFSRAAGGVAPQLSRDGGTAMLFRRALPATRQNSAHPVPIYKMGSKTKSNVITHSNLDVAFWFAVLSPVLGILVGFLFLLLFFH
jgi:hypothetical protein